MGPEVFSLGFGLWGAGFDVPGRDVGVEFMDHDFEFNMWRKDRGLGHLSPASTTSPYNIRPVLFSATS